MYNRILVALDGSALAERVLPHAEALGQKFGATLVLLRATTPPAEIIAAEAAAGVIPVSPAIADPVALTEAEQRDAATYLRGLAERLRSAGHVVEIDEPEGRTAAAILTRARDLRADLIAMTTHGLGGLGRAIFGSVADEVLRHAPCPVLLVRVTEPDGRA
jgi:nucleotide-binding universal stress UspA family protein